MTTLVPVGLENRVNGVKSLLLPRFVAAVLLAGTHPAVGQGNARPNATHFPRAAYSETIAHPQMEKLIGALAGEWITEDSSEGSDQTSRGRTAHARESYRVGPARLSLIQEYHDDEAAGKPWGTGVFWWDDGAKGIRVLWCDSEAVDQGCRVLSEIGRWEGSDFVLTDVHGDSGQRVFVREVWSDLKPDSFTQTVYQGAVADKLRKVLTIKATRVQARAHLQHRRSRTSPA